MGKKYPNLLSEGDGGDGGDGGGGVKTDFLWCVGWGRGGTQKAT